MSKRRSEPQGSVTNAVAAYVKLFTAFPLALVLLFSLLLPAQASAGKGCGGADRLVTSKNRTAAERTIRCLITQERTKRGLKSLRAQRHLRIAAQRFARTLVRRRMFTHTVPGHPDLGGRLRAAGYRSFRRVGENLAWAAGDHATPRRIVRSWMRSSGHRANMLRRDYRDVGVGIAIGTPGKGRGITVASEFGRRR